MRKLEYIRSVRTLNQPGNTELNPSVLVMIVMTNSELEKKPLSERCSQQMTTAQSKTLRPIKAMTLYNI